jgi:hypothetical protein
MSDQFYSALFIYFLVSIVCFLIAVYIVRAIFDLPKIVRMHKAQVRLLEEIAKNQGVEGTKVSSIISESQIHETVGWDPSPNARPAH